MINFEAWCKEVQPKVKDGRDMYKWEDKEDVVFWRGKLTGMNLDKFSVGIVEHNPSPEKIRD